MTAHILALARLLGLNAASRRLTRGSLRILAYHGLWTTPGFQFGDKLFMSPEQFEARMAWLARSNYPVLALDEAVDRLAADTLPDRAVVITIDDGWSSTYTHMLPVLETLALPATVYVSTAFVEVERPVRIVATRYVIESSPLERLPGEALGLGDLDLSTSAARAVAVERANAAMAPLPLDEQIDRLGALSLAAHVPPETWQEGRQFTLMRPHELADASRRGLALELHTHQHRMDRAPGALVADLETNRRVLARATDRPLRHFCYPSGDHAPSDETELRAFGIASATLVAQGLNAPGTNPLRLRRFLDGRSVEQGRFESFLSGTTDLLSRMRPSS